MQISFNISHETSRLLNACHLILVLTCSEQLKSQMQAKKYRFFFLLQKCVNAPKECYPALALNIRVGFLNIILTKIDNVLKNIQA